MSDGKALPLTPEQRDLAEKILARLPQAAPPWPKKPKFTPLLSPPAEVRKPNDE